MLSLAGSSAGAPAGERRIHALDTLRGTASIVVVFWHYQYFFGVRPFGAALMPAYTNGQLAVDVFFVISGFILANVYGGRIRSRADFLSFVVKRIARLYPLHLATLAATALVFAAFWHQQGTYAYFYKGNDSYHLLLNLSLLQAMGLEKDFSFNAPSWSISTEFWVNMLFGVLVLLGALRSSLAALLLAVISAGMIVTYSPQWTTGHLFFGWLVLPVVRTISGFFVGVLVHWLWQRHKAPQNASLAMFWLGLGGMLALMMIRPDHPASTHLGVVLTFVCAPLLVYACATSVALNRAGASGIGQWLGAISYSLYLWHFPLAAVFALLGIDKLWPNPELCAMLYLCALAIVATASHRLIELPAREWVLRVALPPARRSRTSQLPS
ncbi:acyltransferase [Cupriavidus necator]|uniref:Acyltransferase n=1 Tax=Cupriavidus necator TaxID=106590 RepID=A0A367PHQ4_CUPNE|nr:acyltransferase [Cupriavidus necator]QQX83638.1 acyltransferase [Cupriavidus necator]RCJ06767.1 acyltransferase [Cupriavidus necator]